MYIFSSAVRKLHHLLKSRRLIYFQVFEDFNLVSCGPDEFDSNYGKRLELKTLRPDWFYKYILDKLWLSAWFRESVAFVSAILISRDWGWAILHWLVESVLAKCVHYRGRRRFKWSILLQTASNVCQMREYAWVVACKFRHGLSGLLRIWPGHLRQTRSSWPADDCWGNVASEASLRVSITAVEQLVHCHFLTPSQLLSCNLAMDLKAEYIKNATKLFDTDMIIAYYGLSQIHQ